MGIAKPRAHRALPLFVLLWLTASAVEGLGQASKPLIIPPTMKPVALPELDLFAPPPKQEGVPERLPPPPKPAPATEPLPQVPQFSPTAASKATAPKPVSEKPSAPAAKKPAAAKEVQPPTGQRPESLPPEKHSPSLTPSGPEPAAESPWANLNADSLYRPLAAVVMQSEAQRGGGEPNWPGLTVAPPLPPPTPWPDAVAGSAFLVSPVEEREDVSSKIDFGGSNRRLWAVPGALLWQPPLANPREPRMSAKALRVEGENVVDASVGGQFGLVRSSAGQWDEEGWQVDVFGAAFSRFGGRADNLSALDYRFGVPLTYATGWWQFKLAYEHTSSELQGDPLFVAPGFGHEFRREELVFGAARRWGETLRVYGQVGVTVAGTAPQRDEPFRGNLGFEWADLRCTTATGAPFVAIDLEARGDQDNDLNLTAQAGWNWRGPIAGRGPRVAAEYHRGRSPFGQFFTQREEWYGVGAYFDW